jgi:hypothetical protein
LITGEVGEKQTFPGFSRDENGPAHASLLKGFITGEVKISLL